MSFDFTSIIDRRGKDAFAVDWIGRIPGIAPELPKEGFDCIPMWVADMNFPVAPAIVETLTERIRHPLFGYFELSDTYFESIIRWQERSCQVKDLKAEHICMDNGVMGGLVSALKVFCSPGDPVLLQAPVYRGFKDTLKFCGYQCIYSWLVQDENHIWRMDFADMEQKIVENGIHAAVLCSPHNPCGRVWEREELAQAMEVFRKHNVFVVSDEIWSDLIFEGHRHIPVQSISEDARSRTVALYAPTKTFNLAGITGSYRIIYNSWIRDRIEKEAEMTLYNNKNVLSMHALIGAYSPKSIPWVRELCSVLEANMRYACAYIRKHFPGVFLTETDGTYMVFIDCNEWCRDHGKTLDEVLKAGWQVGVGWQDGRLFEADFHIRMNLALPFSKVQEAFERLRAYVFC